MFLVTAIVALITFIFFVINLMSKSKTAFKKYEKIPGPPPKVFLGNVGLFLSSKMPMSQKLFEIYEELHKQYEKDGYFMVYFGHRPVLLLFRPSLVEKVLMDRNFINKPWEYKLLKPWLGDGLLTSDGERWKCKRKLLSHTFDEKVLHQYLPAINDQIKIFLAILKANCSREYVDIRPFVTNYVLDLVSVTTMGISLNAQLQANTEYQNCLRNIFNALLDRICNPMSWYDSVYYRLSRGKEFKENIKILHKFTTNVINQRKKTPIRGCDIRKSRRLPILDLLLLHQLEDSSITDDSIREDVDTFIFGGVDTMFSCLTWTLFLLGCHPIVEMKIKEELKTIFGKRKSIEITLEDLSKMKYIESVLKESLRLYPPAPLIARVAEDNFDLDGHRFPKGFTLYLLLYKCHRDKTNFPNPESFIPERFLNGNQTAFMPFAMGARNCLGQRFAMMSMKCTLAHIFHNMSVDSLNDEKDIKKALEGVLRPVSEIRIKFTED